MKIYTYALPLLLLLASCGKSAQKTGDKNTQPAASINADATEVVGVASVEPLSHIASLYAETGGIVKTIHHDISDEVRKGDVIVELTSDVEEAQLQQARTKLATQYDVVKAAKAQAHSVKVKAENADVNFERNNNLIKSGGVTKKDLDDSRFNSESLKADQASAEANIHQQENRLKELQADVAYYEKILARKQVKAPANGKVLSMEVRIGNNIGSNQAVCDFAPDGGLMAITEVDELFAAKVTEGMRAYLRPQGQSDTLATGKVMLVSPYLHKKSLFSDNAANMEDRRVREVRVLLDHPGKVLIGSRVECVIALTPNN